MKPMRTIRTDLCVIGAGSGGLSAAAGAAQLGRKVVLVEKGEMGGDCLNTGCVPSKALLAAAKLAESARKGAAFGIAPHEPEVDFRAVHDHVHGVIAAIAPHDSQERFEGLGVTVIRAHARFTGPRTVTAGDAQITARRFVIATGSRARVPPIPGLDTVPFLTNETIFENTTRPEHLIIIGAGPIGLEMAQAHRRLGARVSVIDQGRAFPKDDPEMAAIVLERLRSEGIVIREGVGVQRIAQDGAAIAVTIEAGGTAETLTGSHLLVAAGRAANVEDLGLEAANIAHSARGIAVDARLRSTSNRRVFAIGDVAGGHQFTHAAGYHAGIVIRNALFGLPAKASATIPWATYTDPELAHAGLTEAEARRDHGGKVAVVRWGGEMNDRAQAERRTGSAIKIVLVGGRVAGATIVAPNAGDLILPWVLAVQGQVKLAALASVVAPYPTYGELTKRAAGAWFTPKVFSPMARAWVRLVSAFG